MNRTHMGAVTNGGCVLYAATLKILVPENDKTQTQKVQNMPDNVHTIQFND